MSSIRFGVQICGAPLQNSHAKLWRYNYLIYARCYRWRCCQQIWIHAFSDITWSVVYNAKMEIRLAGWVLREGFATITLLISFERMPMGINQIWWVILIIFVVTASIHNARLSYIYDVRSPFLGEVHAVPLCRFVPSSVYMWWDHCAMPPVSPAIVHLAVLSTPDSHCMSVLIIEKINKYHNYFVLYVSLLILDTEGISISYISKLRKLSN